MLQRLVAEGALVNFNDADAEKLIEIRSSLVLAGQELLPTEDGQRRQAATELRPPWRHLHSAGGISTVPHSPRMGDALEGPFDAEVMEQPCCLQRIVRGCMKHIVNVDRKLDVAVGVQMYATTRIILVE